MYIDCILVTCRLFKFKTFIPVPLQVEYLLKKICMAMSIEVNFVELEDFFSQDSVQQTGITVWVFLAMMNSGKLTRGIDKSIISMAIEEVYREIVGDVLKEVGGRSATRNLNFGV